MGSIIPYGHEFINHEHSGEVKVDGSMASLPSIIKLLHDVAKGKGSYFATAQMKDETQFGYRYREVRLTDRVNLILNAMSWVDRFYRGYQLTADNNPYLSSFDKAMESLDVDRSDCAGLRGEDADLFVREMNRLINSYREIVRSAEVKKQIKQLNLSIRKNARNASRYVDYLFGRYAKLLVIRLDVGYGNEAKEYLTYEGADAHKNQLIAYVKKKYPDLVGYIWKLEYTPPKRYHYHLIFFFNGNEVRADVNIGKDIGWHWQSVITLEGGLFYNCNEWKEEYDQVGIGQIRRQDAKKRKTLVNVVVEYLIKSDRYIRAMIPKGRRTFGRGEMLTRKKAIKRMRRGRIVRPRFSRVKEYAP